MKKISYRPVYNRKNRLNADGKALLQIEAYLEQKKIYFSTHIYLKPDQWDKNKKIIKKHPHAKELNYMLIEFILKLEQKELKIWKSGEEITLEQLKENNNPKTENSFLHFIHRDIEHSPIKESTKRNRKSTLKLLALFERNIKFKDVTPHFIHEFENSLYDKRYHTNTIAKHMKHLKVFVNSAIDKGYMSTKDYPFHRYRIKKCEGKHSFLLPEEIQKLENLKLPLPKASLSHTRDAFLFCCYTGLRYSDFTNMSEKNIIKINGAPWLIFQTIKTGAKVKLPLHLLFEGKAWKLLQKYRNQWSSFFAIKPNPTVNKELIKLGKLAHIEKHFSFHSARHTNATLLIYKGANITTVQKLLGHRNIATTQIYSEVMESTIVKDLKKCR